MGSLSVKVNLRDWGLSVKLASSAKRAAHAVTVQAAKDTEKYVPKLNGMLRTDTKAKDNLIIYHGPNARYLYHGKLMVDPETGSAWAKKGTTKVLTDKNLVLNHTLDPDAQAEWFEASKAQNLEGWIRVARRALANDFSG